MRADKYLGQLSRLDAQINNKLQEKQWVTELALHITPSLTGMPRPSGTSDKVGNAAVRLAMLEREIDRIVDRLIDTRIEIVKLLETLPHDEYNVLHQYYVQGNTMEAIAAGWVPKPRSERQVYRIKHRAVRRVQIILDAKEAKGKQEK